MDVITDAPYMSCLLETPAPRLPGDTTLMPFNQESALSMPIPSLLFTCIHQDILPTSQPLPVNLLSKTLVSA